MPAILHRDWPSAAAGLAWQRRWARRVGATGHPAVILMWRSPPALIVTRAESRSAGFALARRTLQSLGWALAVRDCGGSAFPVTWQSWQFAFIAPRQPGVPLSLAGLYACLSAPLVSALTDLGVIGEIGHVAGAFCAGSRDVAVAARKIGGLAQAWRADFTMTTASMLMAGDARRLCAVVNRFRHCLGNRVEVNAECVTTLRQVLAGGTDPDPVRAFRLAFEAAVRRQWAVDEDPLSRKTA